MNIEKKSKSIPRSIHMRNIRGVNLGDSSLYLQIQQEPQQDTIKVELKININGKNNDGAYIKDKFARVPPEYVNYSRKFDITYDKTNRTDYGYKITKVEPEDSNSNLGYLIYSSVKTRGEFLTIDLTDIASREVKCYYYNKNIGRGYMILSVV